MRFSNFVKFTGPEARGPGKGVHIGAGIKMGRGPLIWGSKLRRKAGTVFSLDRIGTYFSEKFVTTRSSGISSVPTRQIMPTRSTAVPTRSATA